MLTPDGGHVVWFDDTTGDEVGHWVRQPFDGGPITPLTPGVPDAWSAGLALGETHAVHGVSTTIS